MTVSLIRTRFSPSPTGNIHLGNARTALFSMLYSLQQGGHFVLRIEDTDAERSHERHVDSLIQDLTWLGLEWQEGPHSDTPMKPYFQSQRTEIYDFYFEQLKNKNMAYPCFCTNQELLLARKIQLSKGEAPRYSGTCARLSLEESEKKLASQKAMWRFRVPSSEMIRVTDLVKGELTFASQDIGDFVIRREDGSSPFLFANAIDDALMKITHVIRGEDHVANTPRQMLILNALQLSVPKYAHASLILGYDGSPLSKRHGSSSVEDLRARGFLPIAIVNYLSRLGHTLDIQELLSIPQLAAHFDLKKISKSPAHFDEAQLLHWQQLALQKITIDELKIWLVSEIQMIPSEQQDLFLQAIRHNIRFPSDVQPWVECYLADQLIYSETVQLELKKVNPIYYAVALGALSETCTDVQLIYQALKDNLNLSGKSLFLPLRMALTGHLHGPELPPLVQLLGYQKVKARLEQAKNYVENV